GLLRPRGEYGDEPGRIRVRQGPDEDRVHEPEDRHVRAETERHHGDCRRGERGMLPKLAESEAQVLDPVLDEAHSTHVAALLHAPSHGTQAALGRDPSLFGRQAGGEALLDLAVEVVAELLGQLPLDAGREKERPGAKPKPVKPAPHDWPTMREMAAESRSHCSASFASALRPERVRA